MGSRRSRPDLDVFQAAYDRIHRLYDRGDRVVVATSGGKDSTVITELAIMAARDTGRLPVEAVTRDEEIMFPGTYEYLRRLATRTDEIDLHWVVAGQPIVNVFNRARPYWWVFDPAEEARWVRSYPGHGDEPQLPGRDAYTIPDQNIAAPTGIGYFPLRGYRGWDDWDDLEDSDRLARIRREQRSTDRARLVTLLGLRTEESEARYLGLLSSGHYVTKHPTDWGAFKARPIYDWSTGDVWKFIADMDADYNAAYDAMTRYGRPAHLQRIAPPTLSISAVKDLTMGSRVWPRWWDRVANRLEGMRTAAAFGKRAISPYRRLGETWREVVKREILASGNPDWIRERIQGVVDYALPLHRNHSTAPLPDAGRCRQCFNPVASWKRIAQNGYLGDPFGQAFTWLDALEPEFFREGAGTWGTGAPTW